MSTLLPMTACMSDISPVLCGTLTPQPDATSALMPPLLPSITAQDSGVCPHLSQAPASASEAINSARTNSTNSWSPTTAAVIGVYPAELPVAALPLGLAPAARSYPTPPHFPLTDRHTSMSTLCLSKTSHSALVSSAMMVGVCNTWTKALHVWEPL